MIQDIFPSLINISYQNKKASDNSSILIFKDGNLLCSGRDNVKAFPNHKDIRKDAHYLFSVDQDEYYICLEDVEAPEGYEYWSLRELRGLKSLSRKDLFVAFTAFHLYTWYENSRFCGHCGNPTEFDTKERAMVCPHCGNKIYPRINPAVIIGIRNGDKLLLTRYRQGYGHNALVAGFTEIGETLEDTVRREVMEEVGLKVKNITYYKSQPWGIALDLLAGFYCDVDGSDEIRMDENELKYAEWVKREDIELQPDDISLTNEMMKMFKNKNK